VLLRIPSVLDRSELDVVRHMLASAPFVDGKLSAGQEAKRVKHNQEVDRHAHELEQLNNLVMGSLVKHPTYRSAAMPLKIAAPYYARYTPGMSYGNHVDDPIMGQGSELYRSDVSVTVFLNNPGDYDGGELVIQTAFGEQQVKLPAGDAVIYPSSSLHRVAEVSRGERLVAVSWIQSLIPEAEKRALLHEMNLARETLLQEQADAEATAQVNHAYINLVRMWSAL